MQNQYIAFISYSNKNEDWVRILHENLERCLSEVGEPRRVYLDKADLSVGLSYINQLQVALDRSDKLLLIATPEALASHSVISEVQAFMGKYRDDWSTRIQIVFLGQTPLPPFLAQIQYADFRDHDEKKYKKSLGQLTASLVGHTDRRKVKPRTPDGIVIPKPPTALPREIRERFVAWISHTLKKDPAYLYAVAQAINIDTNRIKGQPSFDCSASAALVFATGDDNPVKAAIRIADQLHEAFEEVDVRPEELEQLRKDLQSLAVVEQGSDRGLLRTYLDLVKIECSTSIRFHEGIDLSFIERVYVNIDMRLSDRTARDMNLSKKEVSIGGLLNLQPAQQVVKARPWIIYGGPGFGKTTLLRYLAWSLACESDPRWVPIFEPLSVLVREKEWLLDRISHRLSQTGHSARGLRTILERSAETGNLLLLLDGLDEVPREKISRLKNLLLSFMERWPQTTIIVTTRRIGYDGSLGLDFLEAEIMPFSRSNKKDFLTRWFGRRTGEFEQKRAEETLTLIESESGFRDLASNPLYLTLMAFLIEKGKPVRHNRQLIYKEVIGLLLSGLHSPPRQSIKLETVVRRILHHLAYTMTEENQNAEPAESLELIVYNADRQLLKMLWHIPRWERSMRNFLDDLSSQTGIVGPHDGEDKDWRFCHRTFREAQAAEALEEQFRKKGKRSITKHVKEIGDDVGRWVESYALLIASVGDPELAPSLNIENPSMGRALINAHPELTADLIAAIDDWRERCRIYQEIPDRLSDPGRSLELLNNLRCKTRNGNDLFFIDKVSRTVEQRLPECRLEAQQLRLRLYDHIPIPHEDHFRKISVRDGLVEFWHEIPAGEFMMGSEKDENTGLDEQPRHKVTIKSSLKFAVTLIINAQYRLFDPDRVLDESLLNHPVRDVTLFEVISFCRWLSGAFPWARGARLPFEEEWEYVCRAGTETRYWSGDKKEDLNRVAWCEENSGGETHLVGEKPPNPWGVYDIHGNVWEFTLSRWTPSYDAKKMGFKIDPAAQHVADLTVETDERYVIRGGSAWDGPEGARSAYRGHWESGGDIFNIGFRILIPVSP